MTDHERRQLLLARQYLSAPADRVAVCGALNGLQAQILSYARHALALRCSAPLGADWGEGLVKSWTLRGTMHIFPQRDLPLYLHRDRTHYLRDVDRFTAAPLLSAGRKAALADHILRCVDQGITAREALRLACRDFGMTEEEERSAFNSWGGLLRAMCEAGQLCYAVQEQKVFRRCPDFTPMAAEDARLEQARRYFTHFGPASLRDAAYFFGVPQKQVRAWLDQLPVETVSAAGRDCFFLDDGRRDAPEIPACVLLAGFDQLLLGYEKRESVFLPLEYLRGIFTRAGMVLPAVLLDGQVAGRWKVSGKSCAVTCFRPFSPGEREETAAALHRFFPAVARITWAEE